MSKKEIVDIESDMTEEEKEKKVLWIGTSISNQSLREKIVESRTGVKVVKMKAYTVEASMDAWKPEINLRNVLTMALKEVYDTVVN